VGAELSEAAERVQQLADSLCPGHQGGELTLHHPNGKRYVVPLDPCRTRVAGSMAPADAAPRVAPNSGSGEMRENILEALAEAREPLTQGRLAEEAGYSNSGAFRRMLRALVESGHISAGTADHPGYTLAPSPAPHPRPPVAPPSPH
jgi:hypothetical protein